MSWSRHVPADAFCRFILLSLATGGANNITLLVRYSA